MMTSFRRARGIALCCGLIAAAAPAGAETAKKTVPAPPTAPASHPPSTAPGTEPSQSLGSAESWSAYTFTEKLGKNKTGRVCYMIGQPEKAEPAGAARKPPSAMVAHRPDERIANVVSFVEGYPLKDGSDVLLDIGAAQFELFTKDDSAWARTSELDRAIVEALAKGRQAVVKGTPRKGPATTDTYSLAGFSKALAMIDKACDIKR